MFNPVKLKNRSSNIKLVEYNPVEQLLKVAFHSSAASYVYKEVPPALVDELQEADSAGSFVSSRITKVYKHQKIEPEPEKAD